MIITKNILIKVKNDGKLSPSTTIKLDNKYANVVTKINFNLSELLQEFSYKYVAFYGPDSRSFILPLDENNSLVIGSLITKTSGNWKMLFLGKETEIIEDELLTSDSLFVSNVLIIQVDPNFLTDTIGEVPQDENLKIWYEEQEQKINEQVIYLNSDEFKEELIKSIPYFTPKISQDDLILSWTNNGGLENPESVDIGKYCKDYIDEYIIGGES